MTRTNKNLRRSPRRQDIISKLPDEILLQILHKMPLQDAVKTGFLSRRWRDTWKFITKAKFGSSWVESTGKEIVPSVNGFISLHQGPKIKNLSIDMSFETGEMANEVNSWISFATKKNVETLSLNFDANQDNIEHNTLYDPCYELDPSVFQCDSLIYLALTFCRLKLPAEISNLRHLRYLKFYRIELPDNTLQRITSNTPVLDSLVLFDCSRTCNFYIDVAPNPHFDTLLIVDRMTEVHSWTTMEINAPSVKRLSIFQYVPRAEYRIKDVSQCEEVKVDVDAMFGIFQGEEDGWFRDYEKVLLKLLSSFKHVKTLQLCNWCLQILSVSETRNFTRNLSFDCTRLEFYTCFRILELIGIAYMFKACQKVENLAVLIAESSDTNAVFVIYRAILEQNDYDPLRFWKNQELSLVGHLSNLKAVEFKDTREEYYTWNDGEFDLNSYFKGRENGNQLLRILMRNAENLEHVVFSTAKQRHVINRDDRNIVENV